MKKTGKLVKRLKQIKKGMRAYQKINRNKGKIVTAVQLVHKAITK